MTHAWDEKSVFLAALELAGDQREEYLRRACPDELARERIQALLRHHAAVTQEVLSAIPPASPDPSEPVPERIDEFRIIRRLGEGGMGVVYLAEDLVLGRRVALKVLAPGLAGSDDALIRFRTEARTTAAIKHPGIVPVYKFGFDGKTHYIACEYVDGPTLAHVIETERSHRRRSDSTQLRQWCRRAAEIISAIADSLEAAHRHQIIHRDVKPSNILMDREHGPRLTDFGVAKQLADANMTSHTTLVGSCHYMSPEQASIAGAAIDQRSDIFSLGVVLYELLTLRRPFTGATQNEVLRAVAEKYPSRLRHIDARIPRDLEVICQKAIEKRQQDRYQTAAHVAADLRCFLAGDPILAKPPTLLKRAARGMRRHRVGTTGAIALLVCLVGVLGWRDWDSRREKLAWLAVVTDDPGYDVFLQRVDPVTLVLDPEARALGKTPLATQYVPPGHYRVTVSCSKGFAEFNWVARTPGRAKRAELRVRNSSRWSGAEEDMGREMTASMHETSQVVQGMVLIPAGDYQYGWTDEPHPVAQRRRSHVPAFYFDARKVSNRDYREFADATGYPPPGHWSKPRDGSQDFDDLPVVGIHLQEAEAYARWRGKRLPTTLEWDAAARGPDGFSYPWGHELIADCARLEPLPQDLAKRQIAANEHPLYLHKTSPVDRGDPLESRGSILQVFGNVREITGSLDWEHDATLVKGRGWWMSPTAFPLTRTHTCSIDQRSYDAGFRCAKSTGPPDTRTKQERVQ